MSPWANEEFRRALSPDVREAAKEWIRRARDSDEIRAYNRWSQFKLGSLYLSCFGSLWLHATIAGSAWSSVLLVVLNGCFLIPYTRIFMHSQMHWGLSNGVLLNRFYDHAIGALFGVAQSGYALAHACHHRHDNDFSADGFPRDLQSTYMFSRSGRPSSPLLWVPYYIVFFQQFYVVWLVLSTQNVRKIGWLLVEYGLIFWLHYAIARWSPGTYSHVFLPALVVAWLMSAITLYEMHNVGIHDYELHPTVTSIDPFFNWYGDNDGYHIEHTIFPGLHPYFLPKMHALLDPPSSQIYKRQYTVESLGRAIGLLRGGD